MLTFQADADKVINAIAYFAERCPDSTKMKICKLIYYSDKLHLNRYGRPVTGDTYIRMRKGPVPSMGLNLMRHTAYFEGASELFDEVIAVKGIEVKALRAFNRNVFSRSDMRVMHEVMQSFGCESAEALSERSHDEESWKNSQMNRRIKFEMLFGDEPESQQMLKLLQEESTPAGAVTQEAALA